MLIVFAVIWLVGIGLIFYLLYVLLRRAAENKRQATFTAENTIEFVVSGEKLTKTILNRKGYEFDETGPEGGEVKKVDPNRFRIWSPWRYIEENWGFYWVSIFYPWRKIHRFSVFKARVRSNVTDENASVVDRYQIDDGPRGVDHLEATPVMTTPVIGAETKEGFEVDLLIVCNTEVVHPYIAVFKLRGKYKPIFDSAVSNRVNDYMASIPDYTTFRDNNKDKLIEAILKLNDEPTPDTPHGVIKGVGLRITSVIIDRHNLGKKHADAEKALKAEELAIKEGLGKIAAADAQRQTDEKLALGKAAYLREQVKALGTASDAVLQVIRDTGVAEKLAASDKLTVLSLGGNGGVLNTFDVGNVTHRQPDNAKTSPPSTTTKPPKRT